MLRSLGEVREEGERKGDKTEGTSWAVVGGGKREREEIGPREEVAGEMGRPMKERKKALFPRFFLQCGGGAKNETGDKKGENFFLRGGDFCTVEGTECAK